MQKDALIEQEQEILRFWEENNCFEKRQECAATYPPFRFLDGPITANNPMGIHHAWGRSVKDLYIRYKFLRGYASRCQNGFDSQGLWVEVGVEKELGFKTKKDIEAYGLEKFTQACLARVQTYAAVITAQSKRLGQWMDWDNSYFTNTDENIQAIWYFLRKCHEEGLLEVQHKPMPWCPRCGTSLSEHEMTGSYRQMTHESVFFSLPVTPNPATAPHALLTAPFELLGWTTTPWTLAANVALAVHPDADYCLVRCKGREKPIALVKQAVKLLGDAKEAVLGVFKGNALVGLNYETCFPELSSQQGFIHHVVAWEDIDPAEGTGVVHIAPGCGAEDYLLGLRENLPQIMPVDDEGVFLPAFGFLRGQRAADAAPMVFAALKESGKFFKSEPHEHSYPVCWRCKTPILFRLVPSWFIKTQPLKPRLLAAARTVSWNPPSAGKRMEDWLENMQDWNISRKRYYGLPLPFYPCPHCGKLTALSSKEDLRAHAANPADVDALPRLHRPYIDEILIKCPDCGHAVQRIPDTGDVWLDAGIVPFSTTGYFTDRDAWTNAYPADWILEMNEQVRLWFYAMLFMSVVLEDKAPYKKAMCHASVVQEDGSRFSKTGYMIRFDEAAEKIGADAIRYLYAANPMTSDVRFGFALGEEAQRKLLSFRNIYTFFQTYASLDRPTCNLPSDLTTLNLMDQWLLLRTDALLKEGTALLDEFRHPQFIKAFSLFVDDVSNWYIRRCRRRFWKSKEKADQDAAYACLFHALKTATVMISPVVPFLTEHIWQHCVRVIEKDAPLSVHLTAWPESPARPDCLHTKILEETSLVRDVIARALHLRNEQRIKVRQPLATLFIAAKEESAAVLARYEEQLAEELNVRRVAFVTEESAFRQESAAVNFKTAGTALGARINAFKSCLAALTPKENETVVVQTKSGTAVKVPGWNEDVPASLIRLVSATKPGLAVTNDATGDITLALDIVLTPTLVAEGAVRDVIRHCQTLRKESGFAVEQRVTLTLRTENAPLRTIFEDARAHIMEEVLAKDLRISEGKQTSDPSANPAQTTVRVAESDVHITLRGLQI